MKNISLLMAALLVATILPLAFFLLPTQIHERYLLPAIGIWAWAASPSRRWWTGWIVIGAGFARAVSPWKIAARTSRARTAAGSALESG